MPLAIVLAFGALIRTMLMLASSGILWPDSSLYMLSARSMLGPGHYHNHMKTPGYSALLAVFMAFGETPAAGTLFIAAQHLLGLLSTAVLYLIARRLFGRSVAFCSSLVFTAHPLLLYYETSVLSEILFVFVLTILLHQSLPLLSNATRGRAVAVGLLCGLATLTRPVAQGFIVIITVMMIAAAFRDRWRQVVAPALLAGVTYGAVIVPWMFVNSRTYGFWGVSLGSGFGLFSRVFMVDKMDPVADTRHREAKAALEWARARRHSPYLASNRLLSRYRYSVPEVDRQMFDLAFETVRAHP
ncbi:MAG TPA: glycosyltransferase family 39 protein, partial [Longimicrobiales bacterium]|nr:glycosyltransferase family 39 protein [Longimicrobiales bacterium]